MITLEFISTFYVKISRAIIGANIIFPFREPLNINPILFYFMSVSIRMSPKCHLQGNPFIELPDSILVALGIVLLGFGRNNNMGI